MKIAKHQYEISVLPLPLKLGGGYVAIAPTLKGCVADGQTPDEAVSNLADAMQCWIAVAQVRGVSIPPSDVVPDHPSLLPF